MGCLGFVVSGFAAFLGLWASGFDSVGFDGLKLPFLGLVWCGELLTLGFL